MNVFLFKKNNPESSLVLRPLHWDALLITFNLFTLGFTLLLQNAKSSTERPLYSAEILHQKLTLPPSLFISDWNVSYFPFRQWHYQVRIFPFRQGKKDCTFDGVYTLAYSEGTYLHTWCPVFCKVYSCSHLCHVKYVYLYLSFFLCLSFNSVSLHPCPLTLYICVVGV